MQAVTKVTAHPILVPHAVTRYLPSRIIRRISTTRRYGILVCAVRYCAIVACYALRGPDEGRRRAGERQRGELEGVAARLEAVQAR